ncbi:MAG TPA: methionine--tRNA ligase [Candidatus Vogelbacteria bacterium]|nr:methionine--tRNA ligase [Candidatus Vogelbacteria bacterium]
MAKSFYITTTLPYINNEPHVGFALEVVRADIIARYHLSLGEDVFFNTGTDEHGLKILQKATEQNISPQEYADKKSKIFSDLIEKLDIWPEINFIRTTDKKHIKAAQHFWKICKDNGYIYKKKYKAKYCIGCELEKTDSELIAGECPLHPGQQLEIIEEENYFFRFSSFQDKLLELYKKNPEFILPDYRLKEIYNFVSSGLSDFSISRLKDKMPWGIEVPGDKKQVIYVWFDALVNYLTAIGWPEDMEKFKKYWPVIQYCGKDNLRQQSAMWQAMLLAAGLSNSKKIIINGFITADGKKMSKSLGNVISPFTLIDEYGTDALRYYLTRHINLFDDSDYSDARFKEIYNAHLANGLGNLVSRIMKLSSQYLNQTPFYEINCPEEYHNFMNNYNLNEAINFIWQKIGSMDETISVRKPFELIKISPAEGEKILIDLVKDLAIIGKMLEPFMPKTASRIISLVRENKFPEQPLFLRK